MESYYERMMETVFKRNCPVITCWGGINGMSQHYDPQEGLNYTSYSCSNCDYEKTEIRMGHIKHIKRFYKRPGRKAKFN